MTKPDTPEVEGATGGHSPGGFWRPPGKSPVALDTQKDGSSIVEYPGLMHRDAEVKLTEFITMTSGTGESAHCKNTSGVMLALPGT